MLAACAEWGLSVFFVFFCLFVLCVCVCVCVCFVGDVFGLLYLRAI